MYSMARHTSPKTEIDNQRVTMGITDKGNVIANNKCSKTKSN